MQGQGSASGPLPEALEFEGRFMSSCPITNNQFWWHREQNSLEQQLPDFIPIPNDTDASHQSLVGQAGWNPERLNFGQWNSSTTKNGSGYNEQMEFGRTSSTNAFAGLGSGSNNLPYQPTMGTYNHGSSTHVSNGPVVVENSMSELGHRDFLPNSVPSGHASTKHIATASSSAHPSMNVHRTGIIFREENNDGSNSVVVTTHSSDKRKSSEQSWDESSAIASKRSVQIAGSSGLHAASSSHTPGDGSNMSSSSSNIFGLGSPGTLRSGAVLPPRSSLFDSPPASRTTRNDRNVQQSLLSNTNNSVRNSVPTNFALSGAVIRHNSNSVVQRPQLVLPPPQAVEGSNVQNRPISIHCPVTQQQSVNFGWHHNGSSTIPRNSSEPVFSTGTHMEEMGLRNSTQRIQLPIAAPPGGSRSEGWNAMNSRTSGGDANIPVNAGLGVPSDPNPSLRVPQPNLVSNNYRRRRLEQIRQAMLDVDFLLGASANNDPGVYLGIPPETRQRFISQARHMISIGRDMPPLENGIDVRQSLLSALAGIQDQHRDMRLDVDNMSYEELLELGERIGNVKTGLSEETIMNNLKHTMYASVKKSNKPDAEPCSICREEYVEGEDLGTLECGHDYHTNCIKQWLVLKNSCPICKAPAASSSK